ncbi:hypothetical protein QD46_07735 [Paenibacillus polymyxa]|nr:hypothetical protein QD46_07735 [Paenibacillus polymyxa]
MTAVFAYGINEGVRKGLLLTAFYRRSAEQAIAALIANIDPRGEVQNGSGRLRHADRYGV